MHAESSATTSWEGTLAHGSGRTTLASGAAGPARGELGEARAERAGGTTSPEELIAAAHASCYAMAFSHALAEAGATPEHLDISATVTFDIVDGAPTSRARARRCAARASGIDAEGFAQAAAAAKDGCPVSRALAGNVEITLDAALG